VSGLRAWLLQHWGLKLGALLFSVGLWLFVTTEDRGDAVFTVPLEFVDPPPGVEVASLAVETIIVRVEGRRSLLRALREEDFRVEVSLRNARPGQFVARILPEQVSAPPGVRVVRVTPTEIRATLRAG
jgi:YbbR domain-containing protein